MTTLNDAKMPTLKDKILAQEAEEKVREDDEDQKIDSDELIDEEEDEDEAIEAKAKVGEKQPKKRKGK